MAMLLHALDHYWQITQPACNEKVGVLRPILGQLPECKLHDADVHGKRYFPESGLKYGCINNR